MRAAARLFASVKQAKYLEPGAPTGLTGLYTHPSPRGALLFLYHATLDKLKEFPESSVYRQATESLTKHRLSIIEKAEPAGYKEWVERMQYELDENPDAFEMQATSGAGAVRPKWGKKEVEYRSSKAAWDGEKAPRYPEGPRSAAERQRAHAHMAGPKDYKIYNDVVKPIKVPQEPQLTAEQISEVESQIGAGLIEEVIQVAKGEYKLAEEMLKAKAWEPLEEKEPEGQWTYFERGGHTKTQAP